MTRLVNFLNGEDRDAVIPIAVNNFIRIGVSGYSKPEIPGMNDLSAGFLAPRYGRFLPNRSEGVIHGVLVNINPTAAVRIRCS